MIFFFFNDTATTEIYTLPLHDALPICRRRDAEDPRPPRRGRDRAAPRAGGRHLHAGRRARGAHALGDGGDRRSEEHTSELQSRSDLVCRLLLEKKKNG